MHAISLVLLASAALTVAQQPPVSVPPPTTGSTDASYNCPTTCAPPACVCASTSIPGGLSVDQTPQFVTLTADDAIQDLSIEPFNQVLNSTTNPNGCTLPYTYFVSTAWTNFWLVTRAYNQGHEIAVHTMNHPDLVNVTAAVAEQEIVGALQALRTYGGIPNSAIVGFRHPFLSFNKATLDVVAKAGFKYDSSATLDPTTAPYWPHTLDFGAPYSMQPCTGCPPGPQMIYKGMWEIPLYSLLTTDLKLWASMDPIINPQLNDYDIALANLKATFQAHYKTKLPFGLYQHLAQLVAWGPEVQIKKVQLLKDFVAWTRTEFKDVWYVTNQQLISWITKPVPVDQMLNAFPCRAPATDPSNPEICDGIDNNGDGQIDNGLVDQCQITMDASFPSCFGCPSLVPNITQPVPPQKGTTRKPAPADACPDFGTWDPVAGACVNLKRPQVKLPTTGSGGSTGGGQNGGSGKSASAPNAQIGIAQAVVLAITTLAAAFAFSL
ncbi:hypothetical protein DFS34DRAFT_256812 [Phlyctochytrium arcticum]|nr:hypothetical protein DFS34DRAFT_256812 [Phlyctochytrium arcticum]